MSNLQSISADTKIYKDIVLESVVFWKYLAFLSTGILISYLIYDNVRKNEKIERCTNFSPIEKIKDKN